jgi:hypothetical protein
LLFDCNSLDIVGTVSWYERHSVFRATLAFGVLPVPWAAVYFNWDDNTDLSTRQQENEKNNYSRAANLFTLQIGMH